MLLTGFASLSIVLILSLAFGVGLYFLGWILKASSEKTKGKGAPYACGEDLPTVKLQMDVEGFLVYGVYFLVFDIVAFILALSLGTPGFLPALYVIVVLMAVSLLLPLLRRR